MADILDHSITKNKTLRFCHDRFFRSQIEYISALNTLTVEMNNPFTTPQELLELSKKLEKEKKKLYPLIRKHFPDIKQPCNLIWAWEKTQNQSIVYLSDDESDSESE